MIKRICLVLVFSLITVFFSSCDGLIGPTRTESSDESKADQLIDITMAEIVHANSTAELLEKYDSFRITYTYNDEYAYEYYADDTMVFEMDNTFRAVYMDTDCVYWENESYGRVLYAGVEPDDEWSRWLTLNAYPALWEKVVRTYLIGDKLYISTVLPAKYMNDVYDEEEELAAVLADYVLDAETYLILESTVTYKYIDGYRWVVKTRTETNVDVPENADDLVSHMNETTDTRTFTVVLDPDTSKERSYSVTVPKEDYVEFYYPNDYSELYLDRACTRPVTQEDLETDKNMTVYAKSLYPETETAGSF